MRRLLPQRWRLRLWLTWQHLTPGAFRLRRAQASLRRRILARLELRRRLAIGTRGGVRRLSGVRLINLRSRPDRLAASLSALREIGIEEVEVFDAIARDDGLLGAGLSHRGCLQEMLERNWESMLVCEDDVEFLVDGPRLDLLVDEFLDDDSADIACLGFFTWKSRPHSRLYLRGLSVQTASCYIVKKRIACELLQVWMKANDELARGGDRGRYAHDRVWTVLQETHVFLIPILRAARQRQSYSDIQRRVVKYGH